MCVSNDIHIQGDVIKLKDGAELSAQNIRVIASRLLEISAAEDSFEHTMDQKGVSVGTTVKESKSVSIGVNGAQSQTKSKRYKPAQLSATSLMTLESGDELKAIGADLDALDLAMRASTLTVESVQNNNDHKTIQWNMNVNVSTNSVSGSGGVATSKHRSLQTVKSIAHAKRHLSIETNTLKQKGSVIASDNTAILRRADQKSGPVNHIVEDMKNVSITEEKEVNVAVTPQDSFPRLGSYKAHQQYEESISRSTFAAPNLQDEVATAVNRNISQQEIKVCSHKSSFGIAIPLVDAEKIQEDANAMQQALNNLKENIKKTISKDVFKLPKIASEEVKTKNADSKKQVSLKDYAKKVAYEEIVEEIKLSEEKVPDDQIRKAIESEINKHVSNDPGRHTEELVRLGKSLNPNLVNSRKSIDSGIDYIVDKVLTTFNLPTNTRQSDKSDLQNPIKLESIQENQTTRKKLFNANFPDSHPNPFMNHALAVDRGIENACNNVADGVTEVIQHPVDAAANIGICAWDGVNGVSQLAIGVSTAGSRQRNHERLTAIKQQAKEFMNGDSAKKLEIFAQLPSELILGAAVGGAGGGMARKFAGSTSKIAVKTATPIMKAQGLAIETPHGVAFQRMTPQFLKARKQVQEGAHLYRVGMQGGSQAAEGQFWAREIPGKPDYASRHGIPQKNIDKLNFVEKGSLKPGQKVITRKAPPAHDGINPGGAIEVVTPASAVRLKAYINTVDMPAQVIGNKANQSIASRLLNGIIKNVPSPETIGATSAAAIEEVNKNKAPY